MSVVIKIEGITLASNKLAKNSISIREDSQGRKSIGLSLYYTAIEVLPTEGQDIQVYEDTTLLFGGIIKTISPIAITPDQTTSADLNCNITSDGYNSIPQRRTIVTDVSHQFD